MGVVWVEVVGVVVGMVGVVQCHVVGDIQIVGVGGFLVVVEIHLALVYTTLVVDVWAQEQGPHYCRGEPEG